MAIVTKTWTGNTGEYFTHEDMNRVGENANILAQRIGSAQVEYLITTRSSQFRYDEAEKLERQLSDIAGELGVSVPTETEWAAGRMLSAEDFNRWEGNERYIEGEIGKAVRQLTWQVMRGRKWMDPNGTFCPVW